MYRNVVVGHNIVICSLREGELRENGNLEPIYSSMANVSQKHPKCFEEMEYIGIDDVSKLELYEGDIVLVLEGKEVNKAVLWEIKYHIGSFGIFDKSSGHFCSLIKYHEDCLTHVPNYSGNPGDYLKHVGNVFENPELLK